MVEDFSAIRRGVKPRGEPLAGTVSRAVLAVPPLNVCTSVGERIVDPSDGVDAASVDNNEGALCEILLRRDAPSLNRKKGFE